MAVRDVRSFALIVAAILFALLCALPVEPLLLFLVTARSLTDVQLGGAAGALNMAAVGMYALALLALIKVALSSEGRIRFRSGSAVWAAFLLLGIGTGLWYYGPSLALVRQFAPFLFYTLVAGAIVGLPEERRRHILVRLPWTLLPAAVFTIIGGVTESPTLSLGGRAAGTFPHPNSAGAAMVAAALVALTVYLRTSNRWLWIPLFVYMVAAFLTQSLGSVAAGVASCSVLLVASRMASWKKVALALTFSVAGWFLAQNTGVSQRVQSLDQVQGLSSVQSGVATTSFDWRLINWHLLLQAWQHSPFLGYGLGSTGWYIMPLDAPPHSMYVQLLVETGLVGVALILGLMVLGGRSIARMPRDARVLPLVMVVFVMVNGFASNILGYVPALLIAVVAATSSFVVAPAAQHASSRTYPPARAVLQ